VLKLSFNLSNTGKHIDLGDFTTVHTCLNPLCLCGMLPLENMMVVRIRYGLTHCIKTLWYTFRVP